MTEVDEKRLMQAIVILDKELSYFISKYNLFAFMSKEDIEDMRSDCIVVLIGTVKKFDPSLGYKLGTYIRHRIKGFFKDYLKKENKIRTIAVSYDNAEVKKEISNVLRLTEDEASKYLDKLNLNKEKYKEIFL